MRMPASRPSDSSALAGLCASVTEQGIISHHSTPPLEQGGRDPTKTDVKLNQRHSVAISWRFLKAMNCFSDNALNAEFFYFCNKEKKILNEVHRRRNWAKMLRINISKL